MSGHVQTPKEAANQRAESQHPSAEYIAELQPSFSDHRPQLSQLKTMQSLMAGSPQQQKLQALQAKMARSPQVQQNSNVIQRAVSQSTLQYIPSAADLVLITALDAQIANAETTASNAVQNNPAPVGGHSIHQTVYMRNPTARAWGNCVEEQLNIWATGNGWSTQNNSGGSNPDYSRMNGGTKIWADLTTAAEAGAGASHIIDKLNRKVASGEDDSTWVAADVVHAGLNPLAGGPPAAVATNGAVTAAHNNAWQSYKTYKDMGDAAYSDLMERRIREAGRLPSYAVFTQNWTAGLRNLFADCINGVNDHLLPDDEESDEESDDERETKRRRT